MKIRLLFLLAFLFTLQSCDTDDILPALTLTSSSNELSEDQGMITITASLNSELDQALMIVEEYYPSNLEDIVLDKEVHYNSESKFLSFILLYSK